MDQWAQHPQAETALSSILPCVDESTTNRTLYQSKEVVVMLVRIVNRAISALSNRKPHHKHPGQLMPYLCSPYDSNFNDRLCKSREVTFENATTVSIDTMPFHWRFLPYPDHLNFYSVTCNNKLGPWIVFFFIAFFFNFPGMAELHVLDPRHRPVLRQQNPDSRNLRATCPCSKCKLRAVPLCSGPAQFPGLQVCPRHLQRHCLTVLPSCGAWPRVSLCRPGAHRLRPCSPPRLDALCGLPPKGGGVRPGVRVEDHTSRQLSTTVSRRERLRPW